MVNLNISTSMINNNKMSEKMNRKRNRNNIDDELAPALKRHKFQQKINIEDYSMFIFKYISYVLSY